MSTSPSCGYAGVYHGRNLVEIDLNSLRGSTLGRYVERCEILAKNWERNTFTMYEDEFRECCIRDERDRIRERDMQMMGQSRLQDLSCDPNYNACGVYPIPQGACMMGVDMGYSNGCSGTTATKPYKSKASAHDLALKKVFWASRRLKELK